ncbi:pyridoxal phosphate-dependent decarboxylase family protein [Maricaulis sp. CAU 1757]
MSARDSAVGAKAYFPGPQSENEDWVRAGFEGILDDWLDWRKSDRSDDPAAISREDLASPDFVVERQAMSRQLDALKALMRGETATYSPRYAGHMVSELTLPALFGHFTALLHNPNNTSKEVSRVGTVIEAEAISMLAEMVGFAPDQARGHFTSGGTIANFEGIWRARYRLDHWLSLALWIAETEGSPLDLFSAAHMGWAHYGKLVKQHAPETEALRRCSAVAGNPSDVHRRLSLASGRDYLGPVVLVPASKHYSWRKAANVFGLGEEAFWEIGLDANGRLHLDDLERLVDRARTDGRPVLAVVSVAGTTETAKIDPIDRIADRLDNWRHERGWRIWHHVDAAYGGFLCTIPGGPHETVLRPEAVAALKAVSRAHSVTIDPHKLGFVPYACGAFLARDAGHYTVSAFDAPYLERKQISDDPWTATLEGSRSAAGATAVWLTGRTIGFTPTRFGAILAGMIRSGEAFRTSALASQPELHVLEPADANIVCFSAGRPGEALSSANRRTEALYAALCQAGDFVVTTTTLGSASHHNQVARHVARFDGEVDESRLVLIRCVFMNPYWASTSVRDALLPQFSDTIRHALAAID